MESKESAAPFPSVGDIARVEYAPGQIEFGCVSWACPAEGAVEVVGLGRHGRSAGMFPVRMVRAVTAAQMESEIRSLAGEPPPER